MIRVHRSVAPDGVPPFLRWPGGKRWISRMIADLVRPRLQVRYIEPFLGGGSVFFQVLPADAVLSDINKELIATFRAVRSRPGVLRSKLAEYDVSKEVYERVRTSQPDSLIEKAVRVLYLNRTAFGGIYRLNGKGEFNVPYGGGERTTNALIRGATLSEASRALRKAQILCSDFEVVVDMATKGDVVYCDPTYTVAHNNNGFIRYNERNFSWADQERLSAAVYRAKQRGAFVLVSNADHSEIRKLYCKSHITVLQRFSPISPRPQYRRIVDELLITV